MEPQTFPKTIETNGVPIIYTRRAAPEPMAVAERLMAGLVGLCCLSVLCVAAWLHPSPTGYGTHQQLGLAPCAFKERTGWPCPSCGYTTAFTYFAHGNPVASFVTQPMGAVLALFAAMAVWSGFYIAVTGRPVHRLFKLLPSRYYLMPLLSFAMLAWGLKVLQALSGRH